MNRQRKAGRWLAWDAAVALQSFATEERADRDLARRDRWQHASRRYGVSGPMTRADLARMARNA